MDALELLKISKACPDCLPFNLAANGTLSDHESNEAYQVTPRYLFRVISPKSQGENTEIWQRSHDAALLNDNNTIDIFEMGRARAAAILHRHLRWEDPKDGDNLISWTSSQLFAVQYIMYLHNHYQIDFNLIKLCVIDSTDFCSGVFLRDLELIRAFCSSNSDLNDLDRLRRRKHRYYNGYYYFGEYLCQGSLRVEGRCQLVDAKALVDKGLCTLQPRLQEFSQEWANRVIFLREEYAMDTPVTTTEEELQAVIGIAGLFQPRWKLPVASYLLALRQRNSDDERLLHALNPQLLKHKGSKLVCRILAS